MINSTSIIYALLGGILPALVWLAFWLHEDSRRPEPKGLILKTFILGMLTVVLVIPFQKVIDISLPGAGVIAIFLWVILEELFKFGAASVGGLRSVEDNEPIDPIIYMITAALGFAALENALFLIEPIIGRSILDGVITGNLRFIGASLLHVVSSGMIGIMLAFSFYKSKSLRVALVSIGFVIAVIFHLIFNLSILGGDIITPLSMVWVGVVLLLLGFERAKMIAR